MWVSHRSSDGFSTLLEHGHGRKKCPSTPSGATGYYPQHLWLQSGKPVDRLCTAGYSGNVNTVESHPFVRLSGRTFSALVLAPELPLAGWLSALDAQIDRSPRFFEGRAVVVNLAALPREYSDVADLLRDMERRGIRIIGTEGVHPSWEGLDAWGGPLPNAGKPGKPIEPPDERSSNDASAAAKDDDVTVAEPNSLLIDQPVRSGQSVVFERGDVTVLGSVASGAEVMAGGSVHIYGTLRGRAIAGLAGNSNARVFCRKLEAELVAIDGVYQTADDMPATLIGKPVQAWLEGEHMKMTALD